MPDGDFWAINPEELERTRIEAGLTVSQLDGQAFISSVRRIEKALCSVTERVARKYWNALTKTAKYQKTFEQSFVRKPKQENGAPEYKADLIDKAAKRVATHIGQLKPDAVLTFPGASSAFCGWVFARMNPEQGAFCTPIYTALLVNKAVETPEGFKGILTEPKNLAKQIKILLPHALLSSNKILILDDTLITGVVLEALRKELGNRISFACCVAHERHFHADGLPPEFCGIEDPIDTNRFRMPWGDAICFEDLSLPL